MYQLAYLDESPRQPKVSIAGKNDQGSKYEMSKQSAKKDEIKGQAPKLPPKPGQNINYKLPPKPTAQYEPPRSESKQ